MPYAHTPLFPRIFPHSIEIMLSELGPNLYESTLSRPADYGHTFSKVLEMCPSGSSLMHGEAVNVDGYFCAVISMGRGWIDEGTLGRVRRCMRGVGLPVHHDGMTLENCLKVREET